MYGLNLALTRPRASGTPALLASYDFIDSLPGALTHSGNTGTGTASNFRGYLICPSSGARRTDRGLLVEPTATNLANNPRHVGSAAVSFGTAVRTQVLAANSIATTNGSRIVTVTDTGHGRAVGQRVTFQSATAVGGITLEPASNANFTDILAYAIVEIVDANTYRIRHKSAATSTTTGGGTPTARYFAPTADTMATGHTRSLSAGTVTAHLITVTDNTFQTTPTALGARRQYEVVGTGEVIWQHDIIAGFVQNDPVTIQQINAVEGWPNLDWTTTADLTTYEWQLEELNASDVVVATQTRNLLVTSPFSDLCDDARALRWSTTVTNATATKVRFRIRAVAASAHLRLSFYEHSVTKTSWAPSISVPAVGATGTAARTADTATMPVPFTMAARGTINFEFDMDTIVANRDCILSIGALRLTAVGTTFPRSLELTDGTNTATVSACIPYRMYTEDTRKVCASWGPGGLVLSVDGGAAATAGSYTSAGFGTTIRFGENQSSGEKCAIWVKALYLSDQATAAVAAATRSHLLWAVPGSVAGRDYAVGRTSTNPLKVPGVDTLPAGVTRSGQRIQISGSNILIEDWDFRGFHILPGGGNIAPGTIIRQCLFDDAVTGSVFASITMPSQNTPWTFENNTFTSAGDTANPLMTCVIQVQTGSLKPLIRRNIFNGFVRDCINGFDCDVIENVFTAGITQFGAHSDVMQIVGSSVNILIEGNVIDIRNRFGNRAGANYCVYVVDDQAAHTAIVTVRNNVMLGGSYPDSYTRRITPVRGFAQADVTNNYYQRGLFGEVSGNKYTYPSAQTQNYPVIMNYTGNRDLHRPAKTLVLA